ncbi:helix-turn-helix transcriptional regulator [Oceanobacillus sp. 1P07AA]|uniref:helix-turn-helix transcriptional regulator n=1 Tax=Oceanobacillus sp. 1P07AA TaxID=3132293 RepID=UPI0039A6146F
MLSLEHLKQTLIDARTKKGLTHQQVASLTDKGITRQYYGMIENGYRRPSVEVAMAIADVLDIDWTIFFKSKSNQKLQNKFMKEVI